MQLLEQQLVLVPLELLRLEVQGHQQRREPLLLEQPPVRLLHNHRWHNRCWRHMLNRSCCHMMSHSSVLLHSRLVLVHSKKVPERSMMELVRSRLALACSTSRGRACTSGLCT